MKTNKLALILFSTLFVILLSGCMVVVGSGDVVEEERDVSGFDRVSLSGFGEVIIEVGTKESLVIEAEDNIIPYIETEVKGSTLEIGFRNGISVNNREPVIFHLTVVNLEKISVSGSGKITAPKLESGDFEISISGSGDAEVDELSAVSVDVSISGSGTAWIGELSTDFLNLDISGSGKLKVDEGSAEMADVNISGSGKYQADGVRSQDVQVDISGSGEAVVWAENSLDVSSSGSGNVSYYGSPVVSSRGSGSSEVRGLGDRD